MAQATKAKGQSATENENAATPATPATPAKKGRGKKVEVVAEGETTAPAQSEAPKEPGKIEQILALHKAGLSNKEIVEKGFNKTTVSIQVAKYKKANPDLYPVATATPAAEAEAAPATEAEAGAGEGAE